MRTCTVSEDHGHCGDWVFVSGSAAAMAAAFGVRLSLFQHRSQPEQQLVRTLNDPELPRSIRPHVQTIVGLQNFPEPRRRSPPAGAVDALPGIVTPAVLRKIYQVTDVFSGHTNSSQALAEFEGQKYSERDLTTFQVTVTSFYKKQKTKDEGRVCFADQFLSPPPPPNLLRRASSCPSRLCAT